VLRARLRVRGGWRRLRPTRHGLSSRLRHGPCCVNGPALVFSVEELLSTPLLALAAPHRIPNAKSVPTTRGRRIAPIDTDRLCDLVRLHLPHEQLCWDTPGHY
jgi:hypothetical protein